MPVTAADRRPVLVTGGTGFVGTHCIAALLEAGFRVRTTLRSVYRRPDVLEMLTELGHEPGPDLEFAEADLLADAGWDRALTGCQGVLHVASPFPATAPKHEDDLIVPARDGTLRVLRAASTTGVERAVVTSSFAAIGYGHPPDKVEFTENDWSDLTGPVSAYAKSKTLAEQAAWEFAAESGLELAAVNPVAVFGQVLGPDYSTSVWLIKQLLEGRIPALPRLSFGIVDVADVAQLHVSALTEPQAAGERFLAVAGEFWSLRQVARCLRDGELGRHSARVRTRPLPDILARTVGRLVPSLRANLPELGRVRRAEATKARSLLDWHPTENADAVLSTAHSLIDLDLLEPR